MKPIFLEKTWTTLDLIVLEFIIISVLYLIDFGTPFIYTVFFGMGMFWLWLFPSSTIFPNLYKKKNRKSALDIDYDLKGE